MRSCSGIRHRCQTAFQQLACRRDVATARQDIGIAKLRGGVAWIGGRGPRINLCGKRQVAGLYCGLRHILAYGAVKVGRRRITPRLTACRKQERQEDHGRVGRVRERVHLLCALIRLLEYMSHCR